jgi:oligopeptide/dipeptide ABC transporter ATP-binding protein
MEGIMPDTRDVILRLEDVKTWFPVQKGVFKRTAGFLKAVDGVDLDIFKGETLGLVGESGCGKTTLGKSILRLIKTTGGSIEYAEKDGFVNLCNLKVSEMTVYRKRLQIVFQDPYSSLNPAFTVFGSLEEPLIKFGVKNRKDRRRIIGDLLESVNMHREYMDRYPHEFSGGQRQRIGIARALSVNPELIICDEAVSALDVSIRAQVIKLLQQLKEQHRLTYVFITHDLSVVEYISDRIAVMYLGKIIELSENENLYRYALHPYTKALLSAIPVADPNRKERSLKRRIMLKGDVPSPVNPPGGCPFHPRCPEARDRCGKEIPRLKKYLVNGKEHFASCYYITAPEISGKDS